MNYDLWARSYQWESDTINSIRKMRLAYPLTKESVSSAFLATEAKMLDASAESFWQVVAAGKNAIPLLLDMLDDNRPTSAMNDCKTSYLTVSELAYLALNEIADFPFSSNSDKSDDLILSDCGHFQQKWKQPANALNLQRMLSDYYTENEPAFELKPLAENESSSFKKKYGVKGRYEVSRR